MKVWITRYALSRGIYEVEAEQRGDQKMIKVEREGTYADYFHGEGIDWHRTKNGAIQRAEAMRDKKIHSLNQQLGKLRIMTFDKEKINGN